jgi:hypothetical protein
VQGVAILSCPVLEVRIVDPAVLEEAVLDMLVEGHDGFDVLQVVESRTVGDLVQSPYGDQISRDHHESP